MAILYTLVGLPGSGKSTFASTHPECVVVSSDAVRGELFGDPSIQRDARRVFAEVNHRVAQALAEGRDVIYDATSLTRKLRKDIIKKFDATHVCIYIDTDIDTCIMRDAHRDRVVGAGVIRSMAGRLQEPSIEEGYAGIIHHVTNS